MTTRKADLCIIGGGGHVGLPLGLVFASRGVSVLLMDINRGTLDTVRNGQMPFMEHGAEPLLATALADGLLSFTTDPADIAGVPDLIVTIGTPVDEFHNPDTDVMKQWADDNIPYLSDDQLLILRSTVYPGTSDWLSHYLRKHDRNLQVAYCPERIVQGFAVEELLHLPQIISGDTRDAEERAAELFLRIAPSVVRLTMAEAEFAKLFCNSYRYIQFAAANQLYMVSQDAGVDYHKILNGIRDNYPRMKDMPGPGFAAGPCLFKDTMQLAAFSQNHFPLGHAAMLVNEGLILYLVDRIAQKHNLAEMTIGLLGMAFKSDIDDIRSSLSYKLKKKLSFEARSVLCADPHVTVDPDLVPVDEVIEKSDLLLLCVPHKKYKELDTGDTEVIDIWNFLGRGSMI